MPALTQPGDSAPPAYCIESLAGVQAAVRSPADPPPRVRFSVLNAFGRAFTLGLATPILQRSGAGRIKPALMTAPPGQHLLRARLTSAGIYEPPPGTAFPLEGAPLAPERCAYTVSLHFN